MAYVSIHAPIEGEDAVVTTHEGDIHNKKQFKIKTNGTNGMNQGQLKQFFKAQHGDLPDDIFFHKNDNGGIDIATGIEPDWDDPIWL